MSETKIDVYPVGLFSDWRRGRVRAGLRLFVWRYCIRQRCWRSLRNYFNGYLAECYGHPHNAGRGWTKTAALRRVRRICAPAPAPLRAEGTTEPGGEGA